MGHNKTTAKNEIRLNKDSSEKKREEEKNIGWVFVIVFSTV